MLLNQQMLIRRSITSDVKMTCQELSDEVCSEVENLYYSNIRISSNIRGRNKRIIYALLTQIAYKQLYNYSIPYEHIAMWFNIDNIGGLEQLVRQHFFTTISIEYSYIDFIPYYCQLIKDKLGVDIDGDALIEFSENLLKDRIITDKKQYITILCIYSYLKSNIKQNIETFCDAVRISQATLSRIQRYINH